MAGVAGMGTPDSLKPVVPEVEPVSVPDIAMKDVGRASAASPSLDQLWADTSLDDLWDSAQADTDIAVDESPGFLSQAADLASDIAPYTNPITAGVAGIYDYATGGDRLKSITPEVVARARASFGVTDKEKEKSLKSSFGDKNVRKAGEGDFEIKTNGKWKKLDSESWELVGDLADLSRDFVEQGVTEIATLGGLAAGTAAAPLTVGASTVAAPLAARAAGAAGGIAAADLIQKALDIPRDPERSAAWEYGLGVTANAVAGRIGDWAANKIAKRAAEKSANNLLTLGERYERSISEVAELSDRLKDADLLPNIPGSDTPLFLHQLAPEDPNAKALADSIAHSPEFQQAYQLQKDNWNDLTTNWIRNLGDTPGVNTGQKVVDTIEAAQKAEGKFIGDIRKNVIEAAGDGELPVPNLMNSVINTMGEMGFQRVEDRLVAPTIESLMDRGFTKQGAESLVRQTQEVYEKIFNNSDRLNMQEIYGLYQRFSKLSDNLYKQSLGSSDFLYRNEVTKLKNAIRDELTDKINVIMPESGYSSSLKKFSENAKALETIERVMNNDKISTRAFVDTVFSKGKNGRDNVSATKALLKDRPDLWNQLVGEWIEQGIRRSDGDSKKLASFLGKDSEIATDVFGEKAAQTIGDIEKMSKILSSGPVPKSAPERAGLIRSALSYIYNMSSWAAGSTATNIALAADANKVMRTILNEDGIEKYLTTIPKSDRLHIRGILESIMDKGALPIMSSPATRVLVRDRAMQMSRPDENDVP